MTRPSNWSTPYLLISSGACSRSWAQGKPARTGIGWKAIRRRIGAIAGSSLWTRAPAESDSVVVSVFERDRRLLEYLHGLGIHPGAMVRMMASNYDDTLTLHIAGQPVQLGRAAAAKVWIKVSPVRTEQEPVKAGSGSTR